MTGGRLLPEAFLIVFHKPSTIGKIERSEWHTPITLVFQSCRRWAATGCGVGPTHWRNRLSSKLFRSSALRTSTDSRAKYWPRVSRTETLVRGNASDGKPNPSLSARLRSMPCQKSYLIWSARSVSTISNSDRSPHRNIDAVERVG